MSKSNHIVIVLQDEVLRRAVQLHGGKNWRQVADYFEGRTDVQCLHRWSKVLNPNLVKGPWTQEVRIASCALVNLEAKACILACIQAAEPALPCQPACSILPPVRIMCGTSHLSIFAR